MQKQTKSFMILSAFAFNNSAFSRTFANFLNRTYRTFRVSCRTYRTTVCHKLMAHSKLIIGRYNLFQVHFDFCRIVVRCKTYTLCNPLTVCINHNSRLTEYIAKYKVCCFSARSGKTCQVLHCIRYFPAVNVNKPLTAQDYIFRLVAVKSR